MLPYTYVPGLCTPTHPPSGQLPLPIRFRGYACGPGPLASITFVGNVGACGGSFPIYYSTLSFSAPPVLGKQVVVSIMGPPNETAYLYWSLGTTPFGIAFAPTYVCGFYLDIPSLLTLSAAGAEPIASGVLSPVPSPDDGAYNVGAVAWTFWVPGDAGLVGLALGVQAIVVGPSGTLTLAPGLTGQVTAAYQLGLGY